MVRTVIARPASWCPFVLGVLLLCAVRPVAVGAQDCAADCDGGGIVTVDELVKAVTIALGTASIDTCTAADRNQNGVVTVDELVAAVNVALTGCPLTTVTPSAATPTPTSAPTATATPGVPDGIFWHPNSTFQRVLTSNELSSIGLYLLVNKQGEPAAQVTLSGPGGASVTIPYGGPAFIDSRQYSGFYANSPLGLPHTPGATYTLTTVTSIGTASATFVMPGDITIAPDGSQVSWQHDGDSEQIVVTLPTAYDSGRANRVSPFAIPPTAYGAGLVTYRVGVFVNALVTSVAGAAAGSSMQLQDVRFADVRPAIVGPTYTPTLSPTTTPTRTATATPTPTATRTGTILPTPVLTGEILFSSTRDGARHIFVMDPHGNAVQQLTAGDSDDNDPQWNPDKSKIAFRRDGRLHIMNADGSSVMPLRASGMQFAPTFSPDGATIVYADLADDFSKTDLYAYTLATGANAPLLTETNAHAANPTFSPDGAHIFFTSNRDSRFGEIYRMNANGSGVVRITTNEDYEQLGEVSPDGTQLVYAARAAAGTTSLAIHVANVDGSNPVRLTSVADQSDDEHPLWSPTGDYIAYRPYLNGRPKVYRMQADGEYRTDLSRNDAFEVASDWK